MVGAGVPHMWAEMKSLLLSWEQWAWCGGGAAAEKRGLPLFWPDSKCVSEGSSPCWGRKHSQEGILVGSCSTADSVFTLWAQGFLPLSLSSWPLSHSGLS